MAAQKKDKTEKVRAHNYQARQRAHRERLLTIQRDNIFSVVLIAVVIIVLVIVQVIISAESDSSGQIANDETSDSSSDDASVSDTDTDAETPSGDVPPSPDLAEGRHWTGDMSIGDVELGFTLYGDKAPQAVSSFVHLVKEGFFEGVSCHRLVPDGGMQILQCGDPAGNGTGGPGYSFGPIENAPSDDIYPTGKIAMARVGNQADSNGSQFFILFNDAKIGSDSAGGYTVFGEVTSGLIDLEREIKDLGVKPGTNTPVANATMTNISVK